MIKRWISLFLIAALAVTMAGCSGKTENRNHNSGADTVESKTNNEEDEKTENGKETKKEDQITLRFCWWGNEDRHKSTVAALELYMEKNPNVEIISEFLGWDGYLEKLTAQLMSGTSPDIMQVDPTWVMQFWQMEDKFVDMNEQQVIDMGLFADYQGMLNTFTSPSGRLIGLPSGLNFTTLYVNGDLADSIGLDLSKPFTWEQVEEYGKMVQEYDENMYLLASNEIGVDFHWFNTYLLNRCGGYLVNDDFTLGFDYDDALVTFEYVKGLYDKKIVAPFDEMITIQSLWETPGLLNGTIVAAQQQSSNVNTAAASLPDCRYIVPVGDYESENPGYSLRPTNLLSVASSSKYKEEALKVLDFLYTNEDAIDELGLCRSIPVTELALKRMQEQGKIPQQVENVLDFIKKHKGGEGINLVSMDSEFITIEFDVFSSLYYGECTSEEAARQFVDLMQQKADELKEKNS